MTQYRRRVRLMILSVLSLLIAPLLMFATAPAAQAASYGSCSVSGWSHLKAGGTWKNGVIRVWGWDRHTWTGARHPVAYTPNATMYHIGGQRTAYLAPRNTNPLVTVKEVRRYLPDLSCSFYALYQV